MLAKRLIYFERPDLLDEQAKKDFDTAIAKRLLADETTVPWLTLPKAIAEIEHLLETEVEPKRTLLSEHREYLLNRLRTAKLFLHSET
jgi:hypothetical protein